ncbi:glycosyltransferase [Enterococcus camelliae]
MIGRRPVGGIGSVVKNYQSNFSEDIVFDYLLFSDNSSGDFDDFVEKLGSKVYVLPSLKAMRFLTLSRLLDELFRKVKCEYDIVHIHTVNIAFLIVKYAKKYGLTNIVVHSHATKFSDKKINSLRNKFLCRNLTKKCSGFVACSEEAGNFLFGKDFMNSGKVKIIKNAIDIDKYHFSEKKRGLFRSEFNLQNELVMANVGRLSRQKNQKFLIEIFNEVHKKVPASKLFIIGDGEEISTLRKKVKKLNLEEDVIFTGKRNDIDIILSGIDIFVMPSLYEGLPVIGVEALSSGLPCFFSDEISKEFLSSKSHYISLNNDISFWVEEIISAYLSDINRNYIETKMMGYDIKDAAHQLIDYYDSFLYRSDNK